MAVVISPDSGKPGGSDVREEPAPVAVNSGSPVLDRVMSVPKKLPCATMKMMIFWKMGQSFCRDYFVKTKAKTTADSSAVSPGHRQPITSSSSL